jgi:hypothetical protein
MGTGHVSPWIRWGECENENFITCLG